MMKKEADEMADKAYRKINPVRTGKSLKTKSEGISDFDKELSALKEKLKTLK